jgi:predicted nucleotidyltransferase
MPASSVCADIPTKEANFVLFVLFVVETDAFASPLTTIAPSAIGPFGLWLTLAPTFDTLLRMDAVLQALPLGSGGASRADVDKTLLALLAGIPRILAVYLLGSGARGALRPDSDLDLAVLPFPGERFSALELAELAAELGIRAGRPVDLGLLSAANLIYASQAILTGQRIFCRHTFTADHAVASLLGMAAQFHYERREVVHAYSAP